MSDTSKTWLVTGTARGLGRFISEAVLAAGDRLVAGARDPERLVDLVERYGDRIRPVALDVTDEVAARHAVDLAFNTLAHTVLVQNSRTLEDLVREMLKPMLKAWLDDNLPNMVERLVRAEIERVISRATV